MKAPAQRSENKEPPEHQPKPGIHRAVLVNLIDFGMIKDEYKGEVKLRRKIYLRFECVDSLMPADHPTYPGKPMTLATRESFSMYVNARLRGWIEGWYGRGFGDDEADDFDFDELLGKSCNLQISHDPKGWARIMTVLPLLDGQTNCAPTLPLLSFSTDSPHNYAEVPEYLQKRINLPDHRRAEMEQKADAAVDQQSTTIADEMKANPEPKPSEMIQKPTASVVQSGEWPDSGMGPPDNEDFDTDTPF